MAWLRRTESGTFSISFRVGPDTYQRSLQTRDVLAAEFMMAKVKLELRAMKEGKITAAPFIAALISNTHLVRGDFDVICADGAMDPDGARRSMQWTPEPSAASEPPETTRVAPLSIAKLFERYGTAGRRAMTWALRRFTRWWTPRRLGDAGIVGGTVGGAAGQGSAGRTTNTIGQPPRQAAGEDRRRDQRATRISAGPLQDVDPRAEQVRCVPPWDGRVVQAESRRRQSTRDCRGVYCSPTLRSARTPTICR